MIKGIGKKNSNRFYICVNTLFHHKWRKVIPSGTRVLEGCENISYLSNRYILNSNTIINTIYIKQWVNITNNIFDQIVTNRNKEVIELICNFLIVIYKYVINRKGFLLWIIPSFYFYCILPITHYFQGLMCGLIAFFIHMYNTKNKSRLRRPFGTKEYMYKIIVLVLFIYGIMLYLIQKKYSEKKPTFKLTSHHICYHMTSLFGLFKDYL